MVSKQLTLPLAFFFTLLFAVPAMATSVGLVVNGQVRFPEAPPRIENGRVLVPLRTAAEALNASIDFYPDIKEVVITKKSTRVALTVNSTLATLGGSVITLDTPPVIHNGRILVPLRFLGEALGIYVAWDSVTKTVYLSETILYLPGRTKPLSKDTPTYYREGKNKGVKLYQPAYGYVEADTRIDLRFEGPTDMEETVIIVEKGSERSDQPLDATNGLFSGQVWLPFGPGEYTVTVCRPPRGSTLDGLVSFKARNCGLQDVRNLAPIDWIDWNHPDILTLARELSQEDQMATVTAIHDWVAQNIHYDMAAYSLIASGQGTAAPKKASAVLQSRSGVCEHFSRLAAALCRANKIPARVVRGYARREGENWSSEPNHAWNEVLVNGRWITLDVTWDAGYIEGDRFIKSFTRTYLDPDPPFFALTHRKNDAA